MSQQLKSAVRERPILFSGPMVRAILEGRKTQTRRVVKPQFPDDYSLVEVGTYHPTVIVRGEEEPGPETFGAWTDDGEFAQPCPYGQPGDRLWVREAWCEVQSGIRYRADLHEHADTRLRFKPSIHMKREHSRLLLEIAGVRVERIQDIASADIIAEGAVLRAHDSEFGHNPVSAFDGSVYMALRPLWQSGWDSINAKRGFGWDANPWVWRISFKPVDGRPSLKEGSE